ncbi:MAG: hypothetical protein ABH822_02245 [Patescibacteria group bacterium]
MKKVFIIALALALVSVSANSVLAYGGGGGGGGIAQCVDGVDNDLDGKTDYPADTDCTSYNDTTEGVAVTTGATTTVTGESAVAVLQRIAGTPASTLAAGGTSGLSNDTSNVVVAISLLNSAGQLQTYRTTSIAAIRQLLLALIQHTIVIIQVRVTELLAL